MQPLTSVNINAGYNRISRDPATNVAFADRLPRGVTYGAPLGVIVHRQGNPIPDVGAKVITGTGGGAHAINSIRWAIRERAFSAHYYVEGEDVYVMLPESAGAFHVLEYRVAQERGRPVYPDTFHARVPRTLTARPKGQVAGTSRPRGDIGMVGIECVDRVDREGRIYFDRATRRTLVLLVRDILVGQARARGTWLADTYFSITGHQTWDQWTRPDDPGQALYIPSFAADVHDLAMGVEPWRTVGVDHFGKAPGQRPVEQGFVDLREEIAEAEEIARTAQGLITRLRTK